METGARESFAIVEGGYRLVHNFTRPEGMPEYELYDHVADPINLVDLAAAELEVLDALGYGGGS